MLALKVEATGEWPVGALRSGSEPENDLIYKWMKRQHSESSQTCYSNFLRGLTTDEIQELLEQCPIQVDGLRPVTWKMKGTDLIRLQRSNKLRGWDERTFSSSCVLNSSRVPKYGSSSAARLERRQVKHVNICCLTRVSVTVFFPY